MKLAKDMTSKWALKCINDLIIEIEFLDIR